MSERHGSVQQLAELLFAPDRAPRVGSMQVSLPGADTNWHVFVFCLQLLFIGISQGTESVQLCEVDIDTFRFVQDRMARIGIRAQLDVESTPPTGMVGTNFEILEDKDPSSPLRDFVFVYVDGINGSTYKLWFDAFHASGVPACKALRQ